MTLDSPLVQRDEIDEGWRVRNLLFTLFSLSNSLFLFFSLLFLAKQKLMKCQEKRRKRETLL
jgi:hypothetical protein